MKKGDKMSAAQPDQTATATNTATEAATEQKAATAAKPKKRSKPLTLIQHMDKAVGIAKNGKTFDGALLMNSGIELHLARQYDSAVFILEKQ